jgi:uncharacterized protein (TIGR00369 family)
MGEHAVFNPSDSEYEAKIRDSFARQPFMETLKAELITVAPGLCEIKLPYCRELTQHNGFFHAGVVGTIADNAAGYAGYSLMPADSHVLTVEYKLNLLAPGCGDYLLARGKVLKPGKTITTCLSEVFAVTDGDEKLCAVAMVTLICLQQVREYRNA